MISRILKNFNQNKDRKTLTEIIQMLILCWIRKNSLFKRDLNWINKEKRNYLKKISIGLDL